MTDESCVAQNLTIGLDPVTGEKLSGGERAEAVAWTLLTIIPLSKIGKVGKVAKGKKSVKGNEKLSPADKLAKLKDLKITKIPLLTKSLAFWQSEKYPSD